MGAAVGWYRNRCGWGRFRASLPSVGFPARRPQSLPLSPNVIPRPLQSPSLASLFPCRPPSSPPIAQSSSLVPFNPLPRSPHSPLPSSILSPCPPPPDGGGGTQGGRAFFEPLVRVSVLCTPVPRPQNDRHDPASPRSRDDPHGRAGRDRAPAPARQHAGGAACLDPAPQQADARSEVPAAARPGGVHRRLLLPCSAPRTRAGRCAARQPGASSVRPGTPSLAGGVGVPRGENPQRRAVASHPRRHRPHLVRPPSPVRGRGSGGED